MLDKEGIRRPIVEMIYHDMKEELYRLTDDEPWDMAVQNIWDIVDLNIDDPIQQSLISEIKYGDSELKHVRL